MKKMIIALFMLAALPLAAQAADGAKIGSVDIQKVLLQSEAGKEAKEQLSQRAGMYEGAKNSKEEELKKLKSELEKQGIVLSESARATKEREYQQAMKEYQRFLKDAQEDLQAKNDEYTGKIVDEVVRVVQDYGRKNGYTAIFVKSDAMVYLDEKSDLTPEILKAFNASRKK